MRPEDIVPGKRYLNHRISEVVYLGTALRLIDGDGYPVADIQKALVIIEAKDTRNIGLHVHPPTNPDGTRFWDNFYEEGATLDYQI